LPTGGGQARRPALGDQQKKLKNQGRCPATYGTTGGYQFARGKFATWEKTLGTTGGKVPEGPGGRKKKKVTGSAGAELPGPGDPAKRKKTKKILRQKARRTRREPAEPQRGFPTCRGKGKHLGGGVGGGGKTLCQLGRRKKTSSEKANTAGRGLAQRREEPVSNEMNGLVLRKPKATAATMIKMGSRTGRAGKGFRTNSKKNKKNQASN